MITAGIDLGSAAVKIVLLDEKLSLLWSRVVPTSPESVLLSSKLLDEGLEKVGADRSSFLGAATTGYGRNSFSGRQVVVDEITAISLGINHFTDKNKKLVVNIGGQDIKCIKIEGGGKVADFKMNDKCAAGTGRFFEKISAVLNIPVNELNVLDTRGAIPIEINSTCAVFVESEILSFLYKNIDKKDIVAAINRSIARRIGDFIRSFSIEEETYLDGGVALNRNLVEAIQEELMMDVRIAAHPQLTAAIGAAVSLLTSKRAIS
jgi:predicted CoA-substrate-specific enzyme activase